jgi:hypothetical protein
VRVRNDVGAPACWLGERRQTPLVAGPASIAWTREHPRLPGEASAGLVRE